MDTLYYLFCILAIFWLCLWSIRDPRRHSKLWWPFDMKGDAEAPPPSPPKLGPPKPGQRQRVQTRHGVGLQNQRRRSA